MQGGRGGRNVTGGADAKVRQVSCQVTGTVGAGCGEGNGVIWIQRGGKRRWKLNVCQIG